MYRRSAVDSAIKNISWAVERILDDDFPMRPLQENARIAM
jgi:hypothetical protein